MDPIIVNGVDQEPSFNWSGRASVVVMQVDLKNQAKMRNGNHSLRCCPGMEDPFFYILLEYPKVQWYKVREGSGHSLKPATRKQF